MIRSVVTIFSVFFIFTQPTQAAEGPHKYECSNGQTTRLVAVLYKNWPIDSITCAVGYDKTAEGEGKTILWKAENTINFCELKASEFISKLETYGWSCAKQ